MTAIAATLTSVVNLNWQWKSIKKCLVYFLVVFVVESTVLIITVVIAVICVLKIPEMAFQLHSQGSNIKEFATGISFIVLFPVCAPIVEEWMRSKAIKKDVGMQFSIVIALFEGVTKSIMCSSVGMVIVSFGSSLILHPWMCRVQKKRGNRKLAIFIHMMWNSVGVLLFAMLMKALS